MEPNELQESTKSILDKIPDIAFDWYARFVPGFICLALVGYVYKVDLDWLKDKFTILALVAYLIGHILQPFSSGILQKMWPNLKVKKDPLLVKAYSELIGFFSCLLFAVGLLFVTIYIYVKDYKDIITYCEPWALVFSILLFTAAVGFRKKAYDRKLDNQKNEMVSQGFKHKK